MSNCPNRASPGPAPCTPCVIRHCRCMCLRYEMRVRTGRQSIYISSFPIKCFGDIFLAHSKLSWSAGWPRPQVLQSIFSTLSKNVALPSCLSVAPTIAAVLPSQVPQSSHRHRGQHVGSDRDTPVPSHELLRCRAKTAQRHISVGVLAITNLR